MNKTTLSILLTVLLVTSIVAPFAIAQVINRFTATISGTVNPSPAEETIIFSEQTKTVHVDLEASSTGITALFTVEANVTQETGCSLKVDDMQGIQDAFEVFRLHVYFNQLCVLSCTILDTDEQASVGDTFNGDTPIQIGVYTVTVYLEKRYTYSR